MSRQRRTNRHRERQAPISEIQTTYLRAMKTVNQSQTNAKPAAIAVALTLTGAHGDGGSGRTLVDFAAYGTSAMSDS